jgi:hypothetical protein
MQMTLFTRRLAAWAACLAILMSALAPSVSHALALARGVDIAWMEVCSVAGIKLVKADAGVDKAGSPASHDTLAQAGHCPYCSTHAASFALPPTASPAFQLTGGAGLRPMLFYQSPRPLPVWTDAHSRAPPLVS